MMKTSRIYLDTSVIGGCHDKEFAPWSNGLMKDFRLRNFIPIISDLIFEELNLAPEPVKKTLRQLTELDPEIIEINDDSLNLAEIYLDRKILTPKYRDDARHIALATVANVDVLVSWNFKHIVHYDKIRLFNAVNIEQGLKTIDIYSPREVTNYEEKD
jgi:predicted nucleic acid-binding protein